MTEVFFFFFSYCCIFSYWFPAGLSQPALICVPLNCRLTFFWGVGGAISLVLPRFYSIATTHFYCVFLLHYFIVKSVCKTFISRDNKDWIEVRRVTESLMEGDVTGTMGTLMRGLKNKKIKNAISYRVRLKRMRVLKKWYCLPLEVDWTLKSSPMNIWTSRILICRFMGWWKKTLTRVMYGSRYNRAVYIRDQTSDHPAWTVCKM